MHNLRSILVIAVVMDIILLVVCKKKKEAYSREKKEKLKYLSLFQLMNEWVNVKQEGKNLELFFLEHHYKKIAIYGMNYVGRTLINEMQDTDITVDYGIDRNASSIISEIPIFSLTDNLPETDVIVVTPIAYYEEIERELRKKVSCPIVSIDDIVFDV